MYTMPKIYWGNIRAGDLICLRKAEAQWLVLSTNHDDFRFVKMRMLDLRTNIYHIFSYLKDEPLSMLLDIIECEP